MPPRNKRNGEAPTTPVESPITVEITLGVSWENLSDFQNAWPDYRDRLIEYATIKEAKLIIPPRAEAQEVDLTNVT